MNSTDQIRRCALDLTGEAVERAFAGIVAPSVAPRAWNDDEDPNAPWLPKIPGPRTAPAPTPAKIPAPSPSTLAGPAAEDEKPSIPGQRIPAKVPDQPIRQERGETGLICCGRPMTQEGSQWVCGSCGAWTDLGAAGLGAGAGVSV